MIWSLIFVPYVFSLLLSVAITLITINLYRSIGLVDRSTKEDHPKNIHDKPVPRGGGIPVFFSILMIVIMFGTIDKQMIVILVGGFVLLVLGVLDDAFNISPYLRLGLGVVVAGMVVTTGINIKYISNPIGSGVVSLENKVYEINLENYKKVVVIGDVIAVLWIVWGMNFINMGAKGLDGQLPGVVIIAAVVMGILSFRFANDVTTWPSALLAFTLAGSYSGLLIFNKYPQKIMPGWGGGSLAGYFLSILAILSGAKLATALIVLGIPFVDVVYAIVRRILSKKSPVWGDDKHLHHFLLKLGWSKKAVAELYWVITAILGIIALNLNSEGKLYTLILVGVVVGGSLLWLNSFISSNQ